ncbi:cytochrome c biogenesis heme-transporting ATPase CcmA [Limnohabitans sp. INBF002]|uniref:cytochrome c biogenesis heme-transporting ATPase CcmA n=1 Tax=Limnohabitans sp. INBF002 TaxID=2986280 RepID=UPI0023776CB1|nr:cytochrome c biogenesis heme-transporting ATPase CcmA [Limnohabitans sp. INBF002]BDU53883.1 cytochrome c biogenesis ATP-binding export protein CcmA [Limnohabitans sp. INBF002]
MLRVSHLVCSRGNKPLFADVSFALQAGQALHLEGDNGVGKTSLLRIICGLSPADAGEVCWQDKTIQQNAVAFHSSLFYLGHGLSLKEELSALENLMSDAAVSGRTLSEPQAMVALARMGLRGREHLPLRVMSQGQKRRTALARLLASQAPLWVLDEPFVALDVKAVDGLRGLLAEHVANGGMVLFTSHQPVTLTRANGSSVDVQTYRLRGVA